MSVVSDSVRPHRWQSTRLPRPWDSPGKNTGVGCHFLLQCMKVKSESEKWKWSCSVVSDSLRPHGLQPTRLLCSWDFPGKSTGVGCHCLSLYLFIWPHCVACKILVSQPGIQPSPPAVEAQSPNHQTAREFLVWMCFWVRQSVAVFLHRKMSGRIHI